MRSQIPAFAVKRLPSLGWVESPYDPERSKLVLWLPHDYGDSRTTCGIWVEEEQAGAVIRAHSQSRLSKGIWAHILDLFPTLERIVASDQGA